MIEGKGLGGKKVNRVNVSLSNRFSAKLNRLAVACNMRPTTLAGLLIERCLDNPNLVMELQEDRSVHSAYRVLPVKDYNSGEMLYVLNEGR